MAKYLVQSFQSGSAAPSWQSGADNQREALAKLDGSHKFSAPRYPDGRRQVVSEGEDGLGPIVWAERKD